MTRCHWILLVAGALLAEEASPFDKVGENVLYEAKDGAFLLPSPGHDRFGEPMGPMPPPPVLATSGGLEHTAAILYTLDDAKRPSRLILDGKEVEPGEGMPTGVLFPPRGGRVMWFEAKAPSNGGGVPDIDQLEEMMGQQRAVVDGKPECWYVEVEQAAWSEDGAHYAYVGVVHSLLSDTPKADVVLDGKAVASHETVHALRFIPGSARIAFLARNGRESTLVWDRKPEEAYEHIDDRSFVVSLDGRRHAYVGRNGEKGSIVVDGQRLRGYIPWSQGVQRCIDLEPGGQRIAFLQAEEPRLVVLDGETATKYDAEVLWGFTADGKVVAVDKDAQGRSAVCVNGQAEEPIGYIDPRVFWSADRRAFAYQGHNGGEWIVSVGGKRTDPVGWVSSLAFSPDGARVAFLASGQKSGDSKLVIDGRTIPLTNGYGGRLEWTPDGKHVLGIGQRRVSIDERAGAEYDIIGGVRTSADGRRVAYLAASGRRLLLIVAEP